MFCKEQTLNFNKSPQSLASKALRQKCSNLTLEACCQQGIFMFCSGYVGAFLEKRWLLIEVPSWEKKRSPLPSHTHYLLGVSQT